MYDGGVRSTLPCLQLDCTDESYERPEEWFWSEVRCLDLDDFAYDFARLDTVRDDWGAHVIATVLCFAISSDG